MLNCTLCPRKCGAKRPDQRGVCGADTLRVCRAAPHYCEEPPISGKNGSGAVFFPACPLRCVFCQNTPISHGGAGKPVTPYELSEIFKRLEAQGVHNINLVSPTPYVTDIIEALDIYRPAVPVVYNTSGYERVSTLQLLDGYVDIYLPDFKYVSPGLSAAYSSAPDYPEAAEAALREMLRQRGGCEYGDDGMMTSGVIVRHLVLPSHKEESISVLERLSSLFGTEKYLLSLMAQYTPMYGASQHREINRRLTKLEYRRVSDAALRLGFKGFFQEPSSASSQYTPDFDLTGV